MGHAKHQALAEQEDREARWNYVARTNDFACTVCGEIPPYVERDIYFDTKKCGVHAHSAEKQAREE